MDTAVKKVSGHDLIIERTYAAPRDLLFEVWSHPKHLANWWGPHGFTLAHCEMDFRVGGRYRFCMRSPEGEDHWLHGEYREIDEPNKLVFTWKRESSDGSIWCDTLVAVTFREDGGETAFRMHQSGFDIAEHRDQHRGGWSEALERLGDYVTIPTNE